jgi:LysM repeat protein
MSFDFDKMFGTGIAAMKAVDAQQRFDELKSKYQSVLDLINEKGVRLDNLYVDDNKLVISGTAPSEDAKNAVWDQIKQVDASYEDLTVDISVDENLDQRDQEAETYTVKAGDSLWKIAKNHYGDGNQYMKIFYANRDRMKTPNSIIHPGDELRLPKE